jgi:hypothetical protein
VAPALLLRFPVYDFALRNRLERAAESLRRAIADAGFVVLNSRGREQPDVLQAIVVAWALDDWREFMGEDAE